MSCFFLSLKKNKYHQTLSTTRAVEYILILIKKGYDEIKNWEAKLSREGKKISGRMRVYVDPKSPLLGRGGGGGASTRTRTVACGRQSRCIGRRRPIAAVRELCLWRVSVDCCCCKGSFSQAVQL